MKVGRPPMYNTPEEMEGLINNYFDNCGLQPILDKKGNPVVGPKGPMMRERPPTVTGLALALGFTSRQALLNYQHKDEFIDTITRAKAYIEMYTEERLFDKEGNAGARFSLANNFKGWKEKQEIEQTGDISVSFNIPRPKK